MSGISTHVLDTSRGKPAAGIVVTLEAAGPNGWRQLAKGVTDGDGRIAALLPGGAPETGEYRLSFATGDYFRTLNEAVFYFNIAIQVRLEAGTKYHLPLLLSPYGYSTYRGS